MLGNKIRLKNYPVTLIDSGDVLELDHKWKGKIGTIQEIDKDDVKIILESGEKFWIHHQFCEIFPANKDKKSR